MSGCIECGCELETNEVEQGELIECPGCGVDLEVTSVNPVQIDLAPEVQEDWGE